MSSRDLVGCTRTRALTPVGLDLSRCLTAPQGPMQKKERRRLVVGSYRMVTYRGWEELDSHYPAAPVLVLLYRNQGWIGASDANSKFSGRSKSYICHTVRDLIV